MIKTVDKDADNAFECLKVNSKFKICWPSMPNYPWYNVNNFSLSNVIPISTQIYYDTLSLVSRVKSLVYLFFSPKFLCKDKNSKLH